MFFDKGTGLVFFALKVHLGIAEIFLKMTSLDSAAKQDPLYTIFEQHLFNFQDPNSDRNVFVETVIQDYLSHMRRLGLSIPVEWEHQIFEELFFQVNSMLVKKIYGCQTIDEYTAKAPAAAKRKARANYNRLSKAKPKAKKVATKQVA